MDFLHGQGAVDDSLKKSAALLAERRAAQQIAPQPTRM